MREVVEIAKTMGPEQLFLALVFLGCYALALGEFASVRGRVVAAGTGLCAAAGFAAFSSPWEVGVVLVACASVGMGLFSGVVWMLWAATTPLASLKVDQEFAVNFSRASATSSARSVKTAPILNSPAAE